MLGYMYHMMIYVYKKTNKYFQNYVTAFNPISQLSS